MELARSTSPIQQSNAEPVQRSNVEPHRPAERVEVCIWGEQGYGQWMIVPLLESFHLVKDLLDAVRDRLPVDSDLQDLFLLGASGQPCALCPDDLLRSVVNSGDRIMVGCDPSKRSSALQRGPGPLQTGRSSILSQLRKRQPNGFSTPGSSLNRSPSAMTVTRSEIDIGYVAPQPALPAPHPLTKLARSRQPSSTPEAGRSWASNSHSQWSQDGWSKEDWQHYSWKEGDWSASKDVKHLEDKGEEPNKS